MAGLIRYLRGWVRFRVRGGFPERFLNLCALRGIPLWDLRRSGGECFFSTRAGCYRRLRPCARGAGVRLRVVERGGLPFVLRRHRRRWGLAVGAAVCGALLLVSTGFLWNIEVVGNSRLEEQTVLSALERLGVKPGVPLGGIDVRSVERRLMLELDDLGWVAVNLRGSTARVQIQERVLPPALLSRESPCNVVAARGGQITEMRVYAGQNTVAVGDAVAKGDVLVSGLIEDADGDLHLVAARADITAQTTHTLRVEVPLETTRSRLTGVVRRFSLRLGSLELPLWVGRAPAGSFRLERRYTPLRLFGAELPLALGERRYLLLETEEVLLTAGQAEAEADRRLSLLEREALGEAKVLRRTPTLQRLEDRVVLTVEYLLEESIALQSEIFTQTDP